MTSGRTPPVDVRADAAPGGAGAGPPLRLLVVDDHADTLKVLARVLSNRGHHVRTASTVAAALERSAEEPFDVVVSDIGLADVDGHALMRALRHRGDIAGIAVSGYGTPDAVRDSLDAGFAEHLVKPLDLDVLDAAIRRVVTRRGPP